MKKLTNILLLVFLSVVMISGTAYALSGQCASCHTMHASQNGTLMGDGPNDYLLLYSCLGCHSGDVASAVNATSGGPRVLTISGGAPGGQGNGMTLAGGDFYWVANGSDPLGHNVDLVAGQDSLIGPNLGNRPPGWVTGTQDGRGNTLADATWTVQLTCAGTYGCHGDHAESGNDAGIAGTHHSNPGIDSLITTQTTVGASYRFCDYIEGKEDGTWNWTESASLHNEYKGSTYNDGGGSDTSTISFFCAECHGDYHTTAAVGGTTSPWLRHPTDIALNKAGEYQSYNLDTGQYNLDAPVARPVVDGSSPTITVDPTDSTTSSGAIVMCLSCHRAHGSPEPDLLRWTYSSIQAGVGGPNNNTGCFICHTTKDD